VNDWAMRLERGVSSKEMFGDSGFGGVRVVGGVLFFGGGLGLGLGTERRRLDFVDLLDLLRARLRVAEVTLYSGAW
jgi:hypothetical protein